MSDSDLEEPLNTGWFDSESESPGISSVDSTLALGVIVSSPSADQIQVRALDFGDSSATSPAPNRSIPVAHLPLEETGSGYGQNFLDAPEHTPPQSKSQSPIPFHYGLPMGRGRGVRREGGVITKSSTICRYLGLYLGLFTALVFCVRLP